MLSTVALVLAVLAFSAQIVIAIAQFYGSSMQVGQAERVNADTRTALASLTATSEALLSNQRDHFRDVLNAALRTAVPQALDDVAQDVASDAEPEQRSFPFDELERRLAARLETALSARASTGALPVDRPTPHTHYHRLTVMPGEERARAALEALLSLSPWAAATFGSKVATAREVARQGRRNLTWTAGLGPAQQELADKGLLEVRQLPPTERFPVRFVNDFTDVGFDAGAILFLERAGKLPNWLYDRLGSQPVE